jgi:hypothetical protein
VYEYQHMYCVSKKILLTYKVCVFIGGMVVRVYVLASQYQIVPQTVPPCDQHCKWGGGAA